jgi:hypothetical protein
MCDTKMRAEPWHSDRPRLGAFYGLTIWFRPALTEGLRYHDGFFGSLAPPQMAPTP